MYPLKDGSMKNIVSISNARKDLPKMIRKTQNNSETVFKITVRNKTIAEIHSTKPEVVPGEAVRKLIQLRGELSSLKGKSKESISRRVKDYMTTFRTSFTKLAFRTSFTNAL
jgi:hypothetical protein